MKKLTKIIDILAVFCMAFAIVMTAIYLVDISNANKEVESLKKQVMNLETEYKDLSTKADAQKAQSEGQIDKLKAKIDKLEADNRELENKNKELWTENNHLKLEIEDLKAPAAEVVDHTTPVVESEAPQGMVEAAVIIKGEHSTMTEIDESNPAQKPAPSGPRLTREAGTIQFEGHSETYYNLDMSVVVQVAHDKGIGGDYWVREDGAKMLGEYIMVAACYDVHPYGSLVNTSLGMGIVVDTGGFIAWNAGNIDISCDW